MTRIATQTSAVKELHNTLEELNDPIRNPAAKFKAGFAIQQLANLKQPIRIVGSEIEISNANLRCTGTIEIIADRLILNKVNLYHGAISSNAKSVEIRNSKFFESRLSLGDFFNVLEKLDELKIDGGTFWKNSTIHARSKALRISTSLFSGDHLAVSIIADDARVESSFFIDSLPGPRKELDKTVEPNFLRPIDSWKFDKVGAFFRYENHSALDWKLKSSSQRLQSIGSQISEAEAPSETAIHDEVCIYAEDHEFLNQPDCPPSGVFEGNSGEAIFDGPFGLDHWFLYSTNGFPLFFGSGDIPGQLNQELFGLSVRPLGRYFAKSYEPTSINRRPIFEKDQAKPCG